MTKIDYELELIEENLKKCVEVFKKGNFGLLCYLYDTHICYMSNAESHKKNIKEYPLNLNHLVQQN